MPLLAPMINTRAMLVLPEGTAGITPTDLHNTDAHQPRANKRPSMRHLDLHRG
jgi:hypothetical protein